MQTNFEIICRKNPQHKIEFCHKGDTEYETSSSEESETDKPQCK